MRYVIAIDPGNLYGITVVEIPTLKTSVYEPRTLRQFINFCQTDALDNSLISIEDVHAIYGVAANATFGLGRSVGYWTGFFAAFGRTIDARITPAEWQNEYLKLPPPPELIKKPKAPVIETKEEKKLRKKINAKMKNDRRKIIKAMSIDEASKFSGIVITKDGIADAVNIARYVLKYEVNCR